MSDYEPASRRDTVPAGPESGGTSATKGAAGSDDAACASSVPPAPASARVVSATMDGPANVPRVRRSLSPLKGGLIVSAALLGSVTGLFIGLGTSSSARARDPWCPAAPHIWIRRPGIQRTIRAGRPGIFRHGGQRGQIELHPGHVSGSGGNGRRGVFDEVREGDNIFDLEKRHLQGRTRQSCWDRQFDHRQGHAGPRANDRRRIWARHGGRRGPLSEGCSGNVEAGRSDTRQLQSGVRHDRQWNDSQQGDASGAGNVPRGNCRPCCEAEQRRIRGPQHRCRLGTPRLRQPGLQGGRRRLAPKPTPQHVRGSYLKLRKRPADAEWVAIARCGQAYPPGTFVPQEKVTPGVRGPEQKISLVRPRRLLGGWCSWRLVSHTLRSSFEAIPQPLGNSGERSRTWALTTYSRTTMY